MGARAMKGKHPRGPARAPAFAEEYNKKLQIKDLEGKLGRIKQQQEQLSVDIEVCNIRQQALDDFYFFCTKIMGFQDLYEPLHRPLCELITRTDVKRKLILLPRGTFKTTIISICYPLWLLARDSNERVGLCSASSLKAEENLEEIVDRASRPQFLNLFGDRLGHPSKWPKCRKDQVRVHRTGAVTGPSIAAYGVECTEVGRHFSHMLLDDIVDQERVNTPLSRDNVWNWVGRQMSVLDPGCQLILIGTRWHWDDVYSRIQKQLQMYDEEHPIGWWVERRKIVENGKIIFPNRFTAEMLEEIRKIQGEYIFSCFYFNEPAGEGVNPFDSRRFRWIDYKRPEITRDPVEKLQTPFTHIFVDPAASEADHACYSGIVVVDALHDQTVVVRECILQRMHPDDLIARIFELVQIHNPVRVGIEEEAYQKALIFWIRQQMFDRNIYFQVAPVKIPRNVVKQGRLSMLQPFLHGGQICLDKNMPGREALLEELETYPKGPHTDLIVCLSMIPYCTIYPPQRTEPQKEVEVPRTAEFLDRLIQKTRRRRTYMPRVKIGHTNL